MISFVARLNQYILVPIVTEWLEIRDVGHLDSSLCNSTFRERLTEWIYKFPGLLEKSLRSMVVPASIPLLSMLQRRQLTGSVRKLRFSNEMIASQQGNWLPNSGEYVSHLTPVASNIEHIEAYCFRPDVSECIYKTISMFQRLESVRFMNCSEPSKLLNAIDSTSLTELTVSRCFTEAIESVLRLIACNPTILTLRLTKVNTQPLFQRIDLPNLTDLELCGTESIGGRLINIIIVNAKPHTLRRVVSNLLDDACLERLAHWHSESLRVFALSNGGGTFAFMVTSAIDVLQCCKKLTDVSLGLIYDHTLLEAVASLPHLESLECYTSFPNDDLHFLAGAFLQLRSLRKLDLTCDAVWSEEIVMGCCGNLAAVESLSLCTVGCTSEQWRTLWSSCRKLTSLSLNNCYSCESRAPAGAFISTLFGLAPQLTSLHVPYLDWEDAEALAHLIGLCSSLTDLGPPVTKLSANFVRCCVPLTRLTLYNYYEDPSDVVQAIADRHSQSLSYLSVSLFEADQIERLLASLPRLRHLRTDVRYSDIRAIPLEKFQSVIVETVSPEEWS